MERISNVAFAVLLGLVSVMVIVTITAANSRDDSHTSLASVGEIAHAVLSDDAGHDTNSSFSVHVRQPDGPPRIALAGLDPQGRSGSVACSTCHSVRQANFENVSADTLDEFHQGMKFNHGKIACYACHHPDGCDTLRLADGKSVQYESVMTLCAQCHGAQMTAFQHGAHGGMTGHWDLTRGSQIKNNCVDCHDPHEPSYPKMVVGFKPKDRFNQPTEIHQEGH